jgi:hypothetical protein
MVNAGATAVAEAPDNTGFQTRLTLPEAKDVVILSRIFRHCEERSDEAIQRWRREKLDCFAEPVIGRAFARPVGSQ